MPPAFRTERALFLTIKVIQDCQHVPLILSSLLAIFLEAKPLQDTTSVPAQGWLLQPHQPALGTSSFVTIVHLTCLPVFLPNIAEYSARQKTFEISLVYKGLFSGFPDGDCWWSVHLYSQQLRSRDQLSSLHLHIADSRYYKQVSSWSDCWGCRAVKEENRAPWIQQSSILYHLVKWSSHLLRGLL